MGQGRNVSRETSSSGRSFADAELAEHDIQNVFYVDPPSDAPEVAKGDAKALATNPSATIAARMFAVRHLLILTHPYLRYGFAGLVAAGDSSVDANGTVITTIGCAASLSSEAGDQVGIPLPADYADRIRATLDALIAASDTPDSVKRAARCGN